MKNLLLSVVLSSLIAVSYGQDSWNLSNSGIPANYSPNDFAVKDNGDVYLISSHWNGTVVVPNLMKSADAGATWTEITTSGLASVQTTNAIIFSGSKILISGSNSTTASFYVYASTDNGSTWTLSNTGIPAGCSPNDFAVAPNGDIYLAASQWVTSAFVPKLLVSADGGASWTERTMTGITGLQNTNAIVFSGSKLLLCGSGASGSFYVFSSSDNGNTWTPSNTGVPTGYSPNNFTIADNGDIYLASSLTTGSPFVPKLLRSSDNGSTWTDITPLTGLTGLQHTNCITYAGNALLMGGSGANTSSGSTFYVFKSALPVPPPPPVNGIADNANQYAIYPNPCADHLELDLSTSGPATITITDIAARVLFTGTTTTRQCHVNTANMPSGLLFVTVRQNGTSQTKRIVKQ